jgi:hypothetical protein
MTRWLMLFLISAPLFFAAAARAQIPTPATDFEWELQVPNRMLFRDRIPVGEIPLTADRKSGFFGGRKKDGGEALSVWTEVAFVPGDTARFVGVAFELGKKNEPAATAILDAVEIPSLYKSVEYVLATSQSIANTERTDTRVVYRAKCGLELVFIQQGKTQRFEFHYPPLENRSPVMRYLSRGQLSLFKDLLDLTLFELKRQGALLPPISGTK